MVQKSVSTKPKVKSKPIPKVKSKPKPKVNPKSKPKVKRKYESIGSIVLKELAIAGAVIGVHRLFHKKIDNALDTVSDPSKRFMLSCRFGPLFLVKRFYDPGYRNKGLYIAGEYGNNNIIKFLVEKGANVNAVTFRPTQIPGVSLGEHTPMMIAIYRNKLDTVKLLLKLGARQRLDRWICVAANADNM